jgi:hypothetical protein
VSKTSGRWRDGVARCGWKSSVRVSKKRVLGLPCRSGGSADHASRPSPATGQNTSTSSALLPEVNGWRAVSSARRALRSIRGWCFVASRWCHGAHQPSIQRDQCTRAVDAIPVRRASISLTHRPLLRPTRLTTTVAQMYRFSVSAYLAALDDPASHVDS